MTTERKEMSTEKVCLTDVCVQTRLEYTQKQTSAAIEFRIKAKTHWRKRCGPLTTSQIWKQRALITTKMATYINPYALDVSLYYGIVSSITVKSSLFFEV